MGVVWMAEQTQQPGWIARDRSVRQAKLNPATFVVTTFSDGKAGSLRDAIDQANAEPRATRRGPPSVSLPLVGSADQARGGVSQGRHVRCVPGASCEQRPNIAVPVRGELFATTA
jgi:hypothetical protein